MEAMSPLRLMTRAVRFSQTRVRMSAASSPLWSRLIRQRALSTERGPTWRLRSPRVPTRSLDATTRCRGDCRIRGHLVWPER